MAPAIEEVIKKHLLAYKPKGSKRAVYSTVSVYDIARELGIGCDAADELVKDYIDQNM